LLRPGDGVLVKGSRGLHLEETVRWLLDERGP
jgi:UDP-N-acetylmuramyl pentapeptide synthase